MDEDFDDIQDFPAVSATEPDEAPAKEDFEGDDSSPVREEKAERFESQKTKEKSKPREKKANSLHDATSLANAYEQKLRINDGSAIEGTYIEYFPRVRETNPGLCPFVWHFSPNGFDAVEFFTDIMNIFTHSDMANDKNLSQRFQDFLAAQTKLPRDKIADILSSPSATAAWCEAVEGSIQDELSDKVITEAVEVTDEPVSWSDAKDNKSEKDN